MTKTLTEQWRDGTLKTGSYYIRTITGNEKSDYFEGKKFCFWSDYEVEEVLAPVPSYDEYNRLQDMQWSELVEKAKKLGYKTTDLVMGAKEALVKEYKSEGFSLCFTDNGEVFVEGYDCYKLAENRTLKQMFMIMEALNDLG